MKALKIAYMPNDFQQRRQDDTMENDKFFQ